MWLMIIVLCIPFAILLFGLSVHINKEQDKEDCIEGERKYEAKLSVKANHVCGLPLGEKSECKLFLTEKQIVIESFSNVFKLDKSKIMDASIKSTKEIQNSISGAVGGAMLLGPIGAFIGGSSSNIQMFLIFVYKSGEQEEKCISFEIQTIGDRLKRARGFVENFQSNITEKREIEL